MKLSSWFASENADHSAPVKVAVASAAGFRQEHVPNTMMVKFTSRGQWKKCPMDVLPAIQLGR